MKVHSSTQAVFIDFTISALTGLHPLAVAEGLETVFPYIKEIIFVNVPLGKTPVNVRAGGDGAVHQH